MFQLVDLDETDVKILKELQKDERMNCAEISRRTGVPSSTVYAAKIRTTSPKRLNEIFNRIREIEGVDDIFVIPILETFKDEHTVPLGEPVHAPIKLRSECL